MGLANELWGQLPQVMRRCRRAPVVVGVAVMSSLSACTVRSAPDFGEPHGATRQGRDIFHLWRITTLTGLAVGVIVWGLIAFCVLRYRRRSGDEELPKQTRYAIPIEVLYSVVPLVIVASLFAFTLRTQHRVDHLVAHPAVTVEVTGFQWQWRFHYVEADLDVVGTQGEQPQMVLPVGATVRIILRSVDVQHSFFVPAFLFKRDNVPGLTNTADLDVVRAGTYLGHCAEFCGLHHDRMEFTVRAVPRVPGMSMCPKNGSASLRRCAHTP